jgi:hypothetical protein
VRFWLGGVLVMSDESKKEILENLSALFLASVVCGAGLITGCVLMVNLNGIIGKAVAWIIGTFT